MQQKSLFCGKTKRRIGIHLKFYFQDPLTIYFDVIPTSCFFEKSRCNVSNSRFAFFRDFYSKTQGGKLLGQMLEVLFETEVKVWLE